ncbi:hypothetical protein [Parafrankia sp. EUN1f]|uniref:hypothetical protein n=1 Tax=Parafrankia sp. EUN1f TaxID=102897 RepID=UPI0001C439B5|nr:hypothetical protein [Parafrankia sp. EUN1f]EFC85725.1 hypothetical protein FrEUN1fDRAFT_1213 [Parafrankia sp. EUN1f]
MSLLPLTDPAAPSAGPDIDGQIAALQAGAELLARLRGLNIPLYITVHPATRSLLTLDVQVCAEGAKGSEDTDVLRLVRLCLASGALDGPRTYDDDSHFPQIAGAVNGVPVKIYTEIKSAAVQARVQPVLAMESARAVAQ